MGEIVISSEDVSSFAYSLCDWYILGQRTVDRKGTVAHKYKPEEVSGAINITLTKIQ